MSSNKKAKEELERIYGKRVYVRKSKNSRTNRTNGTELEHTKAM